MERIYGTRVTEIDSSGQALSQHFAVLHSFVGTGPISNKLLSLATGILELAYVMTTMGFLTKAMFRRDWLRTTKFRLVPVSLPPQAPFINRHDS